MLISFHWNASDSIGNPSVASRAHLWLGSGLLVEKIDRSTATLLRGALQKPTSIGRRRVSIIWGRHRICSNHLGNDRVPKPSASTGRQFINEKRGKKREKERAHSSDCSAVPTCPAGETRRTRVFFAGNTIYLFLSIGGKTICGMMHFSNFISSEMWSMFVLSNHHPQQAYKKM